MNPEYVWDVVDAQRRVVADLLSGLADEQWREPSLCEGWTVRDVAGHLASQYTTSVSAVVAAMVRARGSLDRATTELAVRHGRRPTEELVEEIRALVGVRRRPAVIGDVEVLTDILVHGMDVAVPLGLDYPVPADAAAVSASRVWAAPWHLRRAFPSTRRYAGIRLAASDAAWSRGEGAAAEAPMSVLLLLLTGRDAAALPRLHGEGADHLRRSLTTP